MSEAPRPTSGAGSLLPLGPQSVAGSSQRPGSTLPPPAYDSPARAQGPPSVTASQPQGRPGSGHGSMRHESMSVNGIPGHDTQSVRPGSPGGIMSPPHGRPGYPASQPSIGPARAGMEIALPELVRVLAHEAAMLRLCRMATAYIVWVVLAILCMCLQGHIFSQYTMGNLLSTEFIEHRFNSDQTLRDVHTTSAMFEWLGKVSTAGHLFGLGVWAPGIWQHSTPFAEPLSNGTEIWLHHNEITSPLELELGLVSTQPCKWGPPDQQPEMYCKSTSLATIATAYFYSANLLQFHWGTTTPVYFPESGEYCAVDYDVAHAGKCPSGWTFHQDKCYQMISTEADFNTAKQRCETSGAVLAEIHSDITEQLLASLVPQGPDWSTPRKWVFADIWLGAQSDEEGALKWDINDVPVLSGFNRMREAITPSKCLFQNEEGLWSLTDCQATKKAYVCQRGQPTTTLPEAYCAPSDYSGTISTTKGGHVCKGWATVPGFEWVGDHNRCRATSFQNNSAWCYVDGAGLTWDYCVLPEPRQCASRCSGMTLSKEIVALAVEDLEGRGWGNGSTSYVQFEFNVYNWNDKILGLLQVTFSITPTGYVLPMAAHPGKNIEKTALQVQQAWHYRTAGDWFRFSCEIMFLLITAIMGFYATHKAYRRRGTWAYHWTKFWTIMDWLILACILTCLILRIIAASKKKGDITRRMVGEIEPIINAAKAMAAVTLILLVFRGFKFFRMAHRTRIFYTTLATAVPVVLTYMGVLAIIVVGYAVAGLYYFGFLFEEYSTFGRALVSTMFLGLGDWSMYGPMTSVLADGHSMFFAGLYLWSYILLMVFLLLNMFIAIAVHVLMRQQTDGPSPTASAPAAVRSPHSIFGFWWPRHFISTRASDCLTLMEGIPWIEKVDLGVRLEKEASVTVHGGSLTVSLHLRSRWHKRLLHHAALLMVLPRDVLVTAADAWHSFLRKVAMKEPEVLAFDDSDLTALFDEHRIAARERHFVRQQCRQLRQGLEVEHDLGLHATLLCGDHQAECRVDVAHHEAGVLLAVTVQSATVALEKGGIHITVGGLWDSNAWRAYPKCGVHPTTYKNLCLSLGEGGLQGGPEGLAWTNPFVVVRCDPHISRQDFGALHHREQQHLPLSRSVVARHPDVKPPRYYRWLIKKNTRCAKAVQHGAKAVGVILNADPRPNW